MKVENISLWERIILVSLIGLAIIGSVPVISQTRDESGQADAKILVAAITQSNESAELKVPSKISAVTVYPDRAQVIRKAQVNLNTETRSLIFSGLPATIIPGSVRVTGSGPARVKILGVEIKTNYLEAEQLPEVKKLLDEIKAVETEISRLKGQEAIFDSQEKFLNSFGTAMSNQVSKELVAGRPDLVGVDKFIEFLGARLQTIQKGRLANSQVLAEKQAKLEALKKKLKEIMPAKSKEEKNISVLVEVNQPGRLEVELSYAVSNVRWQPVYTIKAWPESSEIELTMAANVTQKTGENWDEVKLVLSTSAPTAGNQPGELEPWYLDISQPRVMKAVTREAIESRAMMETETAPALAFEEPAEVVPSWFAVNFEVKKPWTILSDGAERRVPVDSQKLMATFDYLAVPKLQELVFLRGNFKNTLTYPWLAGRADLFINQDFVGTTSLDLVPSNDEVKLFFGEDRQLKVRRELMKREKSGPGFLGKTEKVHLVYKITLESLRNREVEIELQDQIPVSQNAKIEVKDIKITPAPTSRDEKGIVTWKAKLGPKEKQEFTIDFTVEYPKDARIVGL